ncbi:MAG: hypothetical protein JWO60_3268 [Frankiales bacterium]|nr:hypothetical protein [Frankiales bacterium]
MTVPNSGSAPIGGLPASPPPGQPGAGFLPGHPVQGPPLVPVAGPGAPVARGAVPLTPREPDAEPRRTRKAPLAWLPWALLGALLVLLAHMLMAGAVAGGSDDAAKRTGRAAGAPAAASSGPGSLTSNGVDVLGNPAALAGLRTLGGKQAVGRGALVEAVVADEGFWVGSSALNRAFVYLTPEARRSSGESGFQVEKGQRVDLDGVVTGTSAGDPERFGVTDAEGARQLLSQRAYVRATAVRLAS